MKNYLHKIAIFGQKYIEDKTNQSQIKAKIKWVWNNNVFNHTFTITLNDYPDGMSLDDKLMNMHFGNILMQHLRYSKNPKDESFYRIDVQSFDVVEGYLMEIQQFLEDTPRFSDVTYEVEGGKAILNGWIKFTFQGKT